MSQWWSAPALMEVVWRGECWSENEQKLISDSENRELTEVMMERESLGCSLKGTERVSCLSEDLSQARTLDSAPGYTPAAAHRRRPRAPRLHAEPQADPQPGQLMWGRPGWRCLRLIRPSPRTPQQTLWRTQTAKCGRREEVLKKGKWVLTSMPDGTFSKYLSHISIWSRAHRKHL